jgi:hypothetical protein
MEKCLKDLNDFKKRFFSTSAEIEDSIEAPLLFECLECDPGEKKKTGWRAFVFFCVFTNGIRCLLLWI